MEKLQGPHTMGLLSSVTEERRPNTQSLCVGPLCVLEQGPPVVGLLPTHGLPWKFWYTKISMKASWSTKKKRVLA